MRWIVLACVFLIGCDEPAPVKRMPRAERLQAAADKAGQTPPARTFRYPEGELMVIEPLSANGALVERQRCVIWRDEAFKTSSISCGAPEVDLTPSATPRD